VIQTGRIAPTSADYHGSRLVFEAVANPGSTDRGLFEIPLDGAVPEKVLLTESGMSLSPRDWSMDGRFIVFAKLSRDTHLWVLPVFGDRPSRFSPVPSLKIRRRCRPTADGWPMSRANPVRIRSWSGRFQILRLESGRSRQTEEHYRNGNATAGNCSMSTGRVNSSLSRLRRIPNLRWESDAAL
jgi:hypothetical protein